MEARLYKPVDGQKAWQGTLLRMDKETVELQIGEETKAFLRSAVSQVRLCPDLSELDEEEN